MKSLLLPACFLVSTWSPTRTTAQEVVKIYYDAEMVPHIFASTDEGAMYGLGYHHMRDFPMATLDSLWFNSGRMAEIAGACYLPRDKAIHLWEIPAVADRQKLELATNDPEILSMLEAYADGIEAGRAWWRADPARLANLLGPNEETYVQPVPGYLNSAIGPYADDPVAIDNIVNQRLFAVAYPITVEHVLRLGIVLNSGPTGFYNDNQNNPCLAPATEGGAALGSNGWLLSTGSSNGPIVHSSPHTAWDHLHTRMSFVQVNGDEYQAFGTTVPGHPAIILGFNDFLAWGTTASPANTIVESQWNATLLATPELKYWFFGSAGLIIRHKLKLETTTLAVYDPGLSSTSTETYARYYAPEPNTALGLPNNRYPVTVPDSIVGQMPVSGTTVTFEQASFTTESSPYEYFLKLGRARNVRQDLDSIFSAAGMLFGNGDNWFFADKDGWLRHILLSRVPVPGSGVADPTVVLNGQQASQRWTGFHPWQDLPQIGPDQPPVAQAWIVNNCTPDRISVDHPLDLLAFPSYMIQTESLTTWRQDWARERLGTPAAFTLDESEDVAVDETDIWVLKMWPFFETAAANGSASLSGFATQYVNWVNDHRHLNLCDQVDLGLDFLAHEMSQVTVWTTLMSYYYLEELASLSTNELQGSFGTNPEHELFTLGTTAFTDSAYQPNIDAMLWALEKTANPLFVTMNPGTTAGYPASGLWYLGSSAVGLQNRNLLSDWSECIQTPPDPWGSAGSCAGHPCGTGSRYDDLVSCASPNGAYWEGYLPWPSVVRWGQINMLALTPHKLPVGSSRSQAVVDDPCLGVQAIAGALQPRPYQASCGSSSCVPVTDRLSCLPASCSVLPLLVDPYFEYHRPVVFPIGGTNECLFTQRQFSTFNTGNYLDTVYPNVGALGAMYYNAVDQGAYVLYSVQLTPTGAVGRFLASNGGTEITRSPPDSPVDPELAYQDRYASTQEFVDGEWLEAVTAESDLVSAGAHLVTVVY